MSIQVNLSRHPFYNRKLFWIGFLLALVFVASLAQWTMEQIAVRQLEYQILQSKVKQQQQELEILKKRKVEVPKKLTELEVTEIKQAANIIQQKNFSWTNMLTNFEQGLSDKVRIVSIKMKEKEANLANSKISLIVIVSTNAPEEVTKMIAEMDKKGIFHTDIDSQTMDPKSAELTFNLRLTYLQPKATLAKHHKEEVAQSNKE